MTSTFHRRLPLASLTRLALVAAAFGAGAAQAAPQAQGNLGRGLRELVAWQGQTQADLAQPAAVKAFARDFDRAAMVRLDSAGRVLVDVHLDGRRPLADVRGAATRLGARIAAEAPGYHAGMLSAWVPIARVATLAQQPGVRAVLLAVPPVTHAGAALTQGAALIKSDQANALGFTGAGITVGALSDSYDIGSKGVGSAAADVASGDLPGAGNPDGLTAPVVVVLDSKTGEDEGRAMLQIVHDVAPAARLCFATAESTEATFAADIRALADKSGKCAADVIVDDVSYLTEPMFQDGLIAQAVNDVAAQGISYFSAAGNEPAPNGYAATFHPVADGAARAQANTVNLSLIPSSATPGGFHDFGFGGSHPDISQTLVVDQPASENGNSIVLQWNDPFDSGAVSTDYDLYVFSADGTKIVKSSTDHNISTGEPIELVNLVPGTYQIVIARADAGTGKPGAQQLRYVVFGDVTSGKYIDFSAPTMFGHAAADGAIATAAVPWFESYVPEGFTSTGPVTIWFDQDGNKLAKKVVRQKPDVAAPDGGNTTFFGSDSAEDADTQPNFFGTSAAAPHAAAVAALMLQKAGGGGHILPADMKTMLQSSAPAHDLKPNFGQAIAKVGKTTITITANGDGSNASGTNPTAFEISMSAPAGTTLASATLDLSGANAPRVLLGKPTPGLQFDPRATLGFPFTIGAVTDIAASSITLATPLAQAAPFSQQLTLAFAPGSFGTTSSVSFGVDRDETATAAGGGSMDMLAGGTFSGTFLDAAGKAHAFSAPFTTGKTGLGWNFQAGYGLIDALQALQLVK